MKAHIFLIVNPKFQLQIFFFSFGDTTQNAKLNGIYQKIIMYFHNSLILRGAYFLLPLESKQEATCKGNFTKCILKVKVNQLKVKNTHFKMGTSCFKVDSYSRCVSVPICQSLSAPTQCIPSQN